MDEQEDAAPAEKPVKENLGRAKSKPRQENIDNPDVVVSKSGPSKKPGRKRRETAGKTEDQNAEEMSIKRDPDEKLQKKQRRNREETVTEDTEDISKNEEAEKSNRTATSKRNKNETKTSKSEKSMKVKEMVEVPDLEPRRLQLCTTSQKYVGAHVSIQDVLQKSRDMLVDELNRCSRLGLTLYNIHPGSHVGEMPVNKCLELIAEGINYAHSQVPDVIVVLENMSCQGSTVGGRFEELHGIIDLVEDKTRIGVCLDTCHAFAAGHNLSQEKGLECMLDEFDKIVGLSYLRAVHLNDSKGKVGCHLDRHENIGRGHIGVQGFRQVMNEPRFNGIPMILETPYTENFDEIELLYSLCAETGPTKRNTKKASAATRTKK